jgi:hypothetical protein
LKLVGAIEQPVIVKIVGRMCSCVLGHISTGDSIKGSEVGSGSPNYRLTKVVLLLPDE